MNWKPMYLINLIILMGVYLWALYLVIGWSCPTGWRLVMVLVLNVISELGRRWISNVFGDNE